MDFQYKSYLWGMYFIHVVNALHNQTMQSIMYKYVYTDSPVGV